MKRALLFIFLTLSIYGFSQQSWYARPYGGTYGLEDGTSYDNAWDGLTKIVWGTGGVDAGDTLYICGFHTNSNGHYLPVGASGTSGHPIVIDGNCPENDPGMIFGSYMQITSGWKGPDSFGVYTYVGGNVLNNSYGYEDTGASGNPYNFKRLIRRNTVPDSTWLPGSVWIYIDATTGDKTVKYKPSTGIPTDHVVYVESGGGINMNGKNYITIQNLKIWGANRSIRVRGSHNIKMLNNDLRWAAYIAIAIDYGSDSGSIVNNHIWEINNAIYALNTGISGPDDGNDAWYIANNHIHHMSDSVVYAKEGDSHGIGWQNGAGVIIENNHIHHGGGPMIAFWLSSSGYERNNIIRYNYLHDNPVYDSTDIFWSKSGISYGSDNTAQGDRWTENYAYNNIVAGTGSRAIYTKTHSNSLGLLQSGIYNNVVYNTYDMAGTGNAFEGGNNASYEFMNNVLLESEGYKIYQPARTNTSISDREDIVMNYNNYWQSAGSNTFNWEGNSFTDLNNWITGTKGLGFPQDSLSTELNPLYENFSGTYSEISDFTPMWNSPLIDAGTEIINIPQTDILGNPIYGKTDKGAIEYQPPYTIGFDSIDLDANVRVYADGKFRNTAAPIGTKAWLVVEPTGNFIDTLYDEWMNINIQTWEKTGTYQKQWTETGVDIDAVETNHIVGDLQSGTPYVAYYSKNGNEPIHINSQLADGSGQITFTYSAGYHNDTAITFMVLEDLPFDVEPPVAVCKDVTLFLDETGHTTLTPEDVDGGSGDNCGVSSLAVNITGFDCNYLGYNTVILTVIDNSGNTANCIAGVTVVDILPPQIALTPDVEVVTEAGVCETSIDYPRPYVYDNCENTLVLLSGLGENGVFPLGTTTETWVATDDWGNSDTLSFNVTVTAANAAPAIGTIADVTVDEDASPVTVDLTGISWGIDCNAQEVTVSAESSNAGLVSVAVDYTEGETGSLELAITPGMTGESEITVTVTDSEGATATATFKVVVTAVNHAPALVTPIAEQTVNASYELKVPAPAEMFADSDGDELQVEVMQAGGENLPEWATFANDTLVFTPIIADTGCYHLVVKATDPDGAFATDTFQVCVEGYPVSAGEIAAGGFGVNMYPNPTRGEVTIGISAGFHNVELTVSDIAGRAVLRKQYTMVERITFDMSGKVSGMYLVTLDIDGERIVKKLVVDKK